MPFFSASGSSIVLVNVGTDSAFKNTIRKQYNYPPYGLLSIASVLRSHGYTVHLIDLLSESLSREELIHRLRGAGRDTVMVGIPTYTESLHLALEIARIAKRELPEASIVLGGVHASFRPADALLEPSVDFVVRGEGESTIVGLLEVLKHGLSVEKVPGLAWRQNGAVECTPSRGFVCDLDSLPLPAFDMVRDSTAYSSMVSIISSRGCPGTCTFCASGAYSGRLYRKHSAEWLFSLLYYHQHRIRPFTVINFMDDTFTADRSRLRRFHEIVRHNGWSHTWACKSRADTLSKTTIELLAGAGCRSIHIGIESGDQRILDSIQKRVDLRRCLEIVGLLNVYGIRLECSFMIGVPADTLESIDKTLILASVINDRKLGIAIIGIATPFPGTVMSETAEQAGLVFATRDWRNYTTGKPIFSTSNFTIDDLRRASNAFFHQKSLLKGNNIVSDRNLGDFRKDLEQWATGVIAMKEDRPVA